MFPTHTVVVELCRASWPNSLVFAFIHCCLLRVKGSKDDTNKFRWGVFARGAQDKGVLRCCTHDSQNQVLAGTGTTRMYLKRVHHLLHDRLAYHNFTLAESERPHKQQVTAIVVDKSCTIVELCSYTWWHHGNPLVDRYDCAIHAP